ncbi:hypothetical protein DPL33_06170 [Escherichia coli]|uniref:type II secretion system F family protein n=1 Tax=Escherichia coli TaxID=562 RepID=UPI000B7C9673|nr:type II secretion system F family protein [Escherichia coli]EFO3429259.1 hypothetical protein [Escherichia coli]
MASKQLWRWHGITGDGNAQDGMLWAESRTLLLMALQQQMVTPLSLKRIAINSAQWRGDKSAEVIHQLATLLKAGLTLSEGLALLVLFGFLLAIANKLLMRRPTRLIVRQKLLLRIPIMGSLMRGQKLTQIFTILALTQSAGITFLQGVESVRETMRCPYWVQLLTQIQHDISNGQPIWLALKNTGEFSPLCLQLVRTGEASGSLDLMLDNLAHHHRDNTMALADNLAALLEPALLIITGGIIGTLVVAMYLPIFHLGDAMSGMG